MVQPYAAAERLFDGIWLALALYTWDSLHAVRRSPGAVGGPVEG